MLDQPAYDLEEHRSRIPILRSMIPLNSCSQGPLTEAVRGAAERFFESWDRRGMDWPGWMQAVEAARAEFAALIHASPDEVAVTTSLSAAAGSVASAFDFTGSRRRILVSGAEFPTVAHVWQAQERYGAEIGWVRGESGFPAVDDYERLLDECTVLVSACHAAYADGRRQDLAAICERAHARGVLVFADAYQTAGIEPIDVRQLGVDFLASGCLKYLMGTAGIAFLYVRRDLVERLRPAATGWFGRRDPFAFALEPLDWAETARRFDTGTPPILDAFVARAGMALIREIGPAAIGEWTARLSRRLLEGCEERGLEVLGGVDWRRKTPATAVLCEDAAGLESRLRERGVLASARGRALRLAPHYFNTIEDVERALDELARLSNPS